MAYGKDLPESRGKSFPIRGTCLKVNPTVLLFDTALNRFKFTYKIAKVIFKLSIDNRAMHFSGVSNFFENCTCFSQCHCLC